MEDEAQSASTRRWHLVAVAVMTRADIHTHTQTHRDNVLHCTVIYSHEMRDFTCYLC